MSTRPPNFCIFSRDGVSPVGQAGLELLTSGDPPASASQSAGIIGMSYHVSTLDNEETMTQISYLFMAANIISSKDEIQTHISLAATPQHIQ